MCLKTFRTRERAKKIRCQKFLIRTCDESAIFRESFVTEEGLRGAPGVM